MAAMEAVTNFFSVYIDHFLQPLVQNLPAYIRDSIHLLDILQNYNQEPTYLWLSLDVCSLYTSIPYDIRLEAVQHFLLQNPLINPRQAQFILEFTQFCLAHNYFQFENQYYLQIQCTAMGAHFAPSYANITMGLWEQRAIWHNNPNTIYFGRYIDDIIWDGTQSQADDFVAYCNTNNLGVVAYISL